MQQKSSWRPPQATHNLSVTTLDQATSTINIAKRLLDKSSMLSSGFQHILVTVWVLVLKLLIIPPSVWSNEAPRLLIYKVCWPMPDLSCILKDCVYLMVLQYTNWAVLQTWLVRWTLLNGLPKTTTTHCGEKVCLPVSRPSFERKAMTGHWIHSRKVGRLQMQIWRHI